MRAFAVVPMLLLAGAAFAAPDIEVGQVAGPIHVIDGAIDRIGVSAGSDGVLLVDGGYMESADAVKEAIRKLGRGEPRVLINTHWHHAFANPAFDEARIIAHDNVARRMGKPNLMFNRVVPDALSGGMPDETFTDAQSLEFNGERIDIVAFDPAHTDSDAVVIFRNSNVVFTGDLFVPHLPWVDFGSGGSVQGLLAAIDRLIEIVPEGATLIPGHGRTSSYRDLLAYREAVRLTATTVRAGIDSGLSLAEIQKRGLPAGLGPWLDTDGIPANLVIESFYKGLDVERRGKTCEFVNGRWFDGREFVPKAGFWSVEGRLTLSRPESVDCAVDLGDNYILAPFAEAHTHMLATAESLERDGATWLKSGIFYAMVQDPSHAVPDSLLRQASDSEGIEAIYAQGVITPSYGVMPDFYRMMAEGGMLGEGVTFEEARDRLFFAVDSREELQRKWPRIATLNERFVKVILAFSDQHRLRRRNPEFGAQPPQYSRKPGLDPALLPDLVALAHRDRLKVSAHIETAADFRVATSAGVDFIAHLPGAWQIGRETGYEADSLDPWLLTAEDARQAKARGVKVITTAYRPPADGDLERHAYVHARNLATLAEAGVELMIGSDAFGPTVIDELAFLQRLDVIDRARLLDIATRQTPQAMYPGRRIGELKEGYEASFLVYETNPLAAGAELDKPALRVKQGRVLP